jgi:predicted ATP-dependent serine protease
MVREIKANGKTLYVCEACGFAYEQQEWAQKCQKWCEEHHSCNLDITKHAVPLADDDSG